jgi:hypothetical protein
MKKHGKLFGLSISCLVVASTAHADSVQWHFVNKSRWQAQIDFQSVNRNHIWPGGDQAWGLDDGGEHTYRLNCISGEKICYGAWTIAPDYTTGPHYWGQGQNHDMSCTHCCATCGEGETPTVFLND